MDQLLFNRYRIIGRLGKGGMGNVYLAENIHLQTKWAIKEIPVTKYNRFNLISEPNILKKLSHHALPRIVDIYRYPDRLYIIMDYLSGVPMDAYLAQNGRVNERTVLKWARQLCDVLGYLHRQNPPIVYRDMKPGNLIIDTNGDIRLVDFGISQEYQPGESGGFAALTRGYAAPEQHARGAAPDLRSDIFSLGVTLHYMLTGKAPDASPYSPVPIRELVSGLSEGMEEIVEKCTRPSPDRRYQSIAELDHDLIYIHRLNSGYRRTMRLKNLRIAAFAVLLMTFSALTAAGFSRISLDKSTDYAALVWQGAALAAQADYEQAYRCLDEAVAAMPGRADAYLAKANLLLGQYRYDDCLAYVTDTVVPGLPDAARDERLNSLLGTLFYNRGDYGEAAYYYGRAAELASGDSERMRDWIVSLLRSGDTAAAEERMERLMETGVSDGVTWYLDAELALASNDWDRVESSVERCLAASPEEPVAKNAIVLLASVYRDNRTLDSGALAREVALLERADILLKDKNHIEILEMRGEAYYAMGLQGDSGYSRKAASTFRQLLRLGYDRPYIYRNIAVIHQQAGDYLQAEEVLLEARERHPDSYLPCYQLAFVYLDMEGKKPPEERDYSRVLELYAQVVQMTDGTPQAAEIAPLSGKIAELAQKNWIS